MIDIIKDHWFVSILVTIFLGALGSGLWEAVIKPALHKLSKVIFTLLTFGAKRASDRIYKEAARGHHELPSLYVLLFIIAGTTGLLVAVETQAYLVLEARDETAIPEECKKIEGSAEKRACIRAYYAKRYSTVLPYLMLVSIFISVILLYRFIAINRANLIITYFNQCRAIAARYMSHEELLELDHDYALMENKEAYTALIERLNQITTKHDIKLPTSYA